MDKLERQARFVYEVARLQALYNNAPVVPAPFDEREEEFKGQFIELIGKLMNDEIDWPHNEQGFEEAHNSWMQRYFDMGWKYGEKYDPEVKTHPDLVPYKELDLREKVKDEVFLKLVEFTKNYIK